MDPWSVSIDTLFLVLTLLLIPSISRTPQLNITPPGDLLISPPASPLSPITPASASSSHLSVPGVGMPFVVPSIILTPDAPETYSRSRRSSIGSLTKRFGHKRKSVSFSLSAIDDVLPPQTSPNKRRPPTPFVKGPTSPSPSVSSANSQPGTPIHVIAGITGEGTAQSMTHGKDVEDAMGVKKKWLMA
ncbi:hypothetical protein CNE02035 [Cryptococcus deneoformans JEC21]|uniref:Uncharacterized protein n=1 Tax=Cryptococcus deneoformans (strain JEC21 / ATCC MYA-565) TaxID=214684 RepID=A0A0S2LIL4_CRYD1|nr:hypothetical protein CNE02035 [Cryptococcus neoformans var. neoformans JEC21]ALO60564.1 hypothetical protein CNE02035 [Cryptococcus neoformans var. neoformans JEC21]